MTKSIVGLHPSHLHNPHYILNLEIIHRKQPFETMHIIHPIHGMENENAQYGDNYQDNSANDVTPTLINKIQTVTKYIRAIIAIKGNA